MFHSTGIFLSPLLIHSTYHLEELCQFLMPCKHSIPSSFPLSVSSRCPFSGPHKNPFLPDSAPDLPLHIRLYSLLWHTLSMWSVCPASTSGRHIPEDLLLIRLWLLSHSIFLFSIFFTILPFPPVFCHFLCFHYFSLCFVYRLRFS